MARARTDEGFPGRLRALMADRGYNNSSLARELTAHGYDASPEAVRQWLSVPDREPAAGGLATLAHVLQTRVEALAYGRDSAEGRLDMPLSARAAVASEVAPHKAQDALDRTVAWTAEVAAELERRGIKTRPTGDRKTQIITEGHTVRCAVGTYYPPDRLPLILWRMAVQRRKTADRREYVLIVLRREAPMSRIAMQTLVDAYLMGVRVIYAPTARDAVDALLTDEVADEY